ncbi:NAD(P)-dependent oxidoreductase [Thermocoleostomius sinensis A174]|uniref:NAD(P)-dependent oxidoreductase n=2 Tax=Thermocoleostomius TaxID=3065395 RepID=A0A9E9C9Y4_9CYAN|nr:NAD(P)-dependent oxidoreductase [Thermocoleostomius sinensis A174]
MIKNETNTGTIGILGTGLMGLPMAQRLLTAGLPIVAYNRTIAKLEPLRSTDATIAQTVPDLLQSCSVVITMMTDATAIQETLLSDAARSHLADRTVIQMGTIAPSESRQLQQAITAAGGDYLEAPVLGSIPQVQQGSLQVMVGASPEQFEQWRSLLQAFGTPQLIGPVGAAAALKLALNQLIGSLTTAFALSLGFVQQQGGNVDTFMQILRDSALYAPTFDKKLQRMVDHDYTNPNFPTKHLLKDMNLFLQEATIAGLRVDSLDGVRKILEIACDAGLSESDYSALFEAVIGKDEA